MRSFLICSLMANLETPVFEKMIINFILFIKKYFSAGQRVYKIVLFWQKFGITNLKFLCHHQPECFVLVYVWNWDKLFLTAGTNRMQCFQYLQYNSAFVGFPSKIDWTVGLVPSFLNPIVMSQTASTENLCSYVNLQQIQIFVTN